MGPIEELYRGFCERMANEFEREAERYEAHPRLQDHDRQFISVMRERAKRLRQDIHRLEDHYSGRAS